MRNAECGARSDGPNWRDHAGDEPPAQNITAYVALGSNLGDRRANLCGAIDALNAHQRIDVAGGSTFIETDPVGGPPDQGRFLNAVVKVETTLSPHELHDVLVKIEADFGRTRTVPNAPRTLDLDLLLYGDQCINTETLTVPHPRMHQRRFVLEPLAEIAPISRHPVLNQTAAEILADL